MLDFVTVKTKTVKQGVVEVYPEFLTKKSKDLMVRGKAFYAVWDDRIGMWSRDEYTIADIIDEEIKKVTEELKATTSDRITPKLLGNFSSNKWTEWQKYCKSLPDSYHELDEKIIFANTKVKKTDYVSRTLNYSMIEGDISAYEELIGTLYEPSERKKLEWAVGSIIAGDSKDIQKFIVLYGTAGSGKSTFLNILQELFEGYYSVFEAKALASTNNSFALEAFKNNPLIAIQHDGDLSKIEDNTKLNSIISHEYMVVNEKFKATYSSKFNSFLFMGTNKPVKITDAKSGIIRRLIDVHPSGNKVTFAKYNELMEKISFELGAIAYHCYQLYLEMGKSFYNMYRPLTMFEATNDFYNFVEDCYDLYSREDETTLKAAWAEYKLYCEEARVTYPLPMRIFKEELKNYFSEFIDREKVDGVTNRSIYRGFRKDKFSNEPIQEVLKKTKEESWIIFEERESLLDEMLKNCTAQYANEDEHPQKKWENVKTKTKDLDTRQLHYILMPGDHIVADFDIKDKNGNKSLKMNLKAASKWPKTYAELSKSGAGIHLHYIYDGDVSLLSHVYDENVEIKTFPGNASLRRKLTKCNDIPVAHINSGLPLKEGKVVNFENIKSEKAIRTLIKKNLNREYHEYTKPSVDFIFKILEDAYNSGLKYDVTDMRPAIFAFAANSNHQSDICIKMVNNMHFASEEPSEFYEADYEDEAIKFYDVEVFPNLFILCYKTQGVDDVVKLINPSPKLIEEFLKFKIVGFNNRRYDNHILYARMMGYSEEQLFTLSQRIISGSKNAMFGEAYNLSYTDVYDFSSQKQSLKKWEIELGINHIENSCPWDQPVPKERWEEIADYCANDVIATEKVFDHLEADFKARKILADLSGLSLNDTTNAHTTRIIVGNDRNPQEKFVYTDLSDIFPGYEFDLKGINQSRYTGKIVTGKSIYRGEDPSEGGRVYAEPGLYFDVALLDVASEHPTSAIMLNVFGPYTKNFKDIYDIRLHIKHGEYDAVRKMFDGKLAKYLENESDAEDLSYALKIAINSVYGLTSAKFDNKLRDPKNIDNIVAKRGALFMIELQYQLQQMGITVAHIKTDSVKIPNATPEIISWVKEFGKKYGYEFEHEATYEKMCLVNDAVYIAKYASNEKCKEMYGYIPSKQKEGKWTATGKQFQIPYVFKTLFSHEPIVFEDMCETMSVTTALYLDLNEKLPQLTNEESKTLEKLNKAIKNGTEIDEKLYSELAEKEEKSHCYHFVGKVGQFTPVIDRAGGGALLREKDGKYSSATGAKGYKWMESSMVKELGKEDYICKDYYRRLVDEAVASINEFGDFGSFVD